jgi:acyl-CoA thioester hydrolase
MDERVQSSEGDRKGGSLKRAPVLERIAIRYKDLDPYGHVNNAVYLEFFEEIHLAYWRALAGIANLETGTYPAPGT